MKELNKRKIYFIQNKFWRLWERSIQITKILRKKENKLHERHILNIKKSYFKKYLKELRHRKLLKKIYFEQWKIQCKQLKKAEIHIIKLDSYETKKLIKIKKEIFNIFKLNMFQTKSIKYFREQENLRRCLKTDLEEKSKLKKRIQELVLETKDKQLKLTELIK